MLCEINVSTFDITLIAEPMPLNGIIKKICNSNYTYSYTYSIPHCFISITKAAARAPPPQPCESLKGQCHKMVVEVRPWSGRLALN
jgi:hypothetical protein